MEDFFFFFFFQAEDGIRDGRVTGVQTCALPIWVPLLLVIICLLADVFFLPSRLAALVGMDFGYRLFVSGVLLVPLGFVMGMPFPTGLRAFAALPAPEYPA